ncbi:MAG: hypothetical protein KA369_22960 [Spirochaetes bacterium]|nr:hypothetical protein [Spirochaetota bacterium]
MTNAGARPTVATVFGILDIVFGALAMSSLRFWTSMHVFVGDFYNIILIAGALLGILLLAAGILLMMNKAVALHLNLYYAFISIGLAVVRTLYMVLTGGIGGIMVWIFAVTISLVYPLLILVILLRDEEVKKFYASR